MQKRLLPITVFALASLVAVAAFAVPTSKTISGNPLKINIWSDGSFQVFNASVPGHGQIYPTTSQSGDMGVFANIDNKLYSPDFRSHQGTATSNLGTYTAWQTVSISEVSGDGSASSPFTVAVSLKAPDNDVTVGLNVLYVQGQNFFRIQKQISQTATHHIDVMLGADIYLSGSDNGVFLSVPELNAVGGSDCLTPPTYHILLIGITAANEFGTGGYSDVWSMIAANHLTLGTPGACVDNGAALRWTNVTANASSVLIESAVSFGDIPSASSFISFNIEVQPAQIVAYPGDTVSFKIVTQHNADSGFNSPLDLVVDDMPPGFTVKLDSTQVPAPGDGTITGTITIDPTVPFGSYQNLRIFASGGGQRAAGVFNIEIVCDPPMILGVNQPMSQSVTKGTGVTLHAKTEHTGPFTYQWFNGHAGFTSTPIASSNSPDLNTGPINSTQEYWVHVTNACGAFDSQTATITPR